MPAAKVKVAKLLLVVATAMWWLLVLGADHVPFMPLLVFRLLIPYNIREFC
jgi:hypothetical protein